MKKFLSLVIAVCVLSSCAALLISCDQEHEHTFGEEWVYDKKSHWHECNVEDCIEISDKADHVWGDEVVVTEATPDSDGVSEKKCSVCNATENASVAFAGISENKWDQMLADSVFENYTLSIEGRMTVTQSYESGETVSDMKSILKIASDKISLELFGAEVDGTASDSHVMVLDGDIAEAQKLQNSQLFMLILDGYENFEYDAETGTYKITEAITIKKDLAAIAIGSDGNVQTKMIPSTIEIRNAEATLSDDGKILKLVCDYSQTMEFEVGMVTTTSGVTTWTFSDYGTTVIE